jgi:uncharacterized protein
MAIAGTFLAVFAGMAALFLAATAGFALLTRRVGGDRVRRWLGGSRGVAATKGLLLGLVTPFCSWSTVPVLLELLRARVRISAVAAFYLASPLLDPVLLVALAVLFGPRLAGGYAAVVAVVTLGGAVLAEKWERFGFRYRPRWWRFPDPRRH